MIRLLRRLIGTAVGAFAITFLGVVLQTALVRDPPHNTLESVDVIVCLGAGMDPDGTLHPSAIARVETCAALYLAGTAPDVHFTGGRGRLGGPSAGAQMSALAQTLGVPPEAISIEEASQSTLQNALLSQPMLADAQSIRLVTEGFHLPRSYASFALMGDHTVHLTMSEPVRLTPQGRWNWRVLLRETLAIWFNIGRYGVWLIMGVFETEGRDAILA